MTQETQLMNAIPYIFYREEGFYPIELNDDADAIANAECNPGTLRVEDTDGRIVWVKPFTWADLKKAINEIPEDQLSKPVVIWREDEAFRAGGLLILEEDYVNVEHWGGEGCAPISEMKRDLTADELESFDEDYPVVYTKGTPILWEKI